MKEIRKPIVANNLVASHSHIHVQGPLVYISLLLLSRFKIQSWDHTKSAKHILKLHMALQSLSETAFIQTWSLSHCCSVSSNSQSSVQKRHSVDCCSTCRLLIDRLRVLTSTNPNAFKNRKSIISIRLPPTSFASNDVFDVLSTPLACLSCFWIFSQCRSREKQA